MQETLFAAINVVVLFVSLGLLAISLGKRKRLTSEAAWEGLIEKKSFLKTGILLTFVSLIMYLFAESAELLNLESPSSVWVQVYEIGDAFHMAIVAVAVLLVIPLFNAMMRGEDGS